MGINLVTFYNSTVTPQDDALIYENALPGSGMIYGGNVTIKNANTLHVTAGHGALCGRKFTIEETDVPVQLTSSGTLNGRLYIHMDLSNVDEPITLEVERASTLTPPVQQSNVNITDGIYEINLATFQISTSTISNLVYVAPFIHYEFLKEVIIAPVEKTNVASQNYVVGRHLILNGILYKVTAAITAGQTIAVGTNVAVSDDVEKQIETNLSNINTINSNKLNQTVIATRQANLTASKAYVVGEQFIYNNTLYVVTAAISKNAAITIGGNCKAADNITTQISNVANLIPKNYGIEDIPLQRGGAMDANLAFKRVRIFGANSGALPAFATSGNNDMIVINHWYADSGDSTAIQVAYNLRADNIAFRRFLGGWQPWHTII